MGSLCSGGGCVLARQIFSSCSIPSRRLQIWSIFEEITRQLVARDIEVLDELRKEEKGPKEEEEAEGARDEQPVGVST